MSTIKKPIALITGATGCIGSAITKKMINNGFFVVGIGRNKLKGIRMNHELGKKNFSFHSIDVGSYEEIESMFKEDIFKNNTLELVITCAGILKMDKTDNFPVESWNEIIKTNLTGTFYFLKESLKLMKKNNRGSIISIGSRWGESGAKNAAAYSASKSALRALIKSVQLECVNTKIRCLLISPGSVSSDMSNYVKNDISDKLLDARDIAELIAYISKTPDHVIFDEITMKAFPYDLLN